MSFDRVFSKCWLERASEIRQLRESWVVDQSRPTDVEFAKWLESQGCAVARTQLVELRAAIPLTPLKDEFPDIVISRGELRELVKEIRDEGTSHVLSRLRERARSGLSVSQPQAPEKILKKQLRILSGQLHVPLLEVESDSFSVIPALPIGRTANVAYPYAVLLTLSLPLQLTPEDVKAMCLSAPEYRASLDTSESYSLSAAMTKLAQREFPSIPVSGFLMATTLLAQHFQTSASSHRAIVRALSAKHSIEILKNSLGKDGNE